MQEWRERKREGRCDTGIPSISPRHCARERLCIMRPKFNYHITLAYSTYSFSLSAYLYHFPSLSLSFSLTLPRSSLPPFLREPKADSSVYATARTAYLNVRPNATANTLNHQRPFRPLRVSLSWGAFLAGEQNISAASNSNRVFDDRRRYMYTNYSYLFKL